MSETIQVDIVGAPVACAEGVKDTWRDMADWAADQLGQLFGPQVVVAYHDLFEVSGELAGKIAGGEVTLPAIFVGGELLSSGDKISVPAIRRRLETMGLRRVDS